MGESIKKTCSRGAAAQRLPFLRPPRGFRRGWAFFFVAAAAAAAGGAASGPFRQHALMSSTDIIFSIVSSVFPDRPSVSSRFTPN